MGRVYLAFTPGGRPVALKVVRPEFGGDEDFRARFRQEIQAARRVHGLYTAQVLDAGPDADPPWLVTAYVAGPSLAQAVREYGPMPPQTVFQLMAGVAEALQAIHAAGVVHRDLKPSNVLLAPDGPRVIDFGIARAVEATTVTRTGMRVGSPQFMAPEQIAGRSIARPLMCSPSARWPPSPPWAGRRSVRATRPTVCQPRKGAWKLATAGQRRREQQRPADTPGSRACPLHVLG